MTTEVDIVNRALQAIGDRTTVTALQLQNNSNNQAIQSNSLLIPLRDQLLRMAPWNCGTNTAYLTYITSLPGTPQNPTPGTQQWEKGQPAPPFAYEYQYPEDCLKPMWVIPQFQPGWVGTIPLTPVQNAYPAWYNGPPIKFSVGVDQFFGVTAAIVVNGGSGYAIGDEITLEGTPQGSVPIGAPARLRVLTLGVGSAIATVEVISNVFGADQSGSYFQRPTNPVSQGSTTGSGVGATFTLTLTAKGDQRVILTNQEQAALKYVKRVTDPNVMDEIFQDAWALILGARLAMALTGDKTLANMKIQEANAKVIAARTADGNEGITVNDVTPDWIRVRGIDWPSDSNWGPDGIMWGQLFPLYS